MTSCTGYATFITPYSTRATGGALVFMRWPMSTVVRVGFVAKFSNIL